MKVIILIVIFSQIQFGCYSFSLMENKLADRIGGKETNENKAELNKEKQEIRADNATINNNKTENNKTDLSLAKVEQVKTDVKTQVDAPVTSQITAPISVKGESNIKADAKADVKIKSSVKGQEAQRIDNSLAKVNTTFNERRKIAQTADNIVNNEGIKGKDLYMILLGIGIILLLAICPILYFMPRPSEKKLQIDAQKKDWLNISINTVKQNALDNKDFETVRVCDLILTKFNILHDSNNV